MSAIQVLFQQAQLAEAAYANFSGMSASTPTGAIENALIAEKFSPAQAATFVSQWRVVDQYTAPFTLGVIGTGFSGTLFQRPKGTGVDFFLNN